MRITFFERLEPNIVRQWRVDGTTGHASDSGIHVEQRHPGQQA